MSPSESPAAPAPQAPFAVARSRPPAAPAAAQAVIPADIRELLGPAPLTRTEDHAAYEAILARLAPAVSPADFIDWTWVKDLADCASEAQRARRAVAARLALARKSAIHQILQGDRLALGLGLLAHPDPWKEAETVYAGERASLAKFETALRRLGLGPSAVEDAAFVAARDAVERLEALAERACARREAVVREIERRRRALAERARLALAAQEPAIDAEFE